MSGATRICCCACGAHLNQTIVRYQLEHYDLICHATGQGRVVTVDAAVACSTRCLTAYLAAELESAQPLPVQSNPERKTTT